MKHLLALALALATSSAFAASVNVTWDQISDPSVAGFIIRYGPSSTNKSQTTRVVGNTNSAVVIVPDNTRVFMDLMSVSDIGVLSFPSAEFNFSTARPPTPTGFKLTNNAVVVTVTVSQ